MLLKPDDGNRALVRWQRWMCLESVYRMLQQPELVKLVAMHALQTG